MTQDTAADTGTGTGQAGRAAEAPRAGQSAQTVRARRAGVARFSGWAAGVSAAGLTALVLWRHGAQPGQIALFGLYLAAGVSVPGTLLWRAVRGRPGHLAEDLAAGTALGWAVEVLTYLPARRLGLPLLFLAWPVVTLAVFTVVPRLRRHWRGGGRHAPAWWSWGLCAAAALLAFWGSRTAFPGLGLAWPANRSPHVDMTFHLALIGELKHHVPPAVPWVHGEPLRYHWFVHADVAAASWATGLEPQLLLYRLSLLPMAVVFTVSIAALARQVSRRWWTGPAAAAAALLAVAPSPYPWVPSVDADPAQLSDRIWLSPTQTFGAALFVPLVILSVDVLRGRRRGAVIWAGCCVLLAAVIGAKATFLPILLAALLLTTLVDGAVRRRFRRAALGLAGTAAAATLFAQFVFYGGASQGMIVDPSATVRYVAARLLPGHPPTTGVLAATFTALLLAWGLLWAGAAGLVLARRARVDPATMLLLGIGGAGLGGLLTFSQLGLSQYYFSRSATPYLAVAAVCGIAAVSPTTVPPRPVRPVTLVALLCAAVAGAAATPLARTLTNAAPPRPGAPGEPAVALLLPLLVLLIVTACAATAAAVAVRRLAGAPGPGIAAALAVFTAAGLPATAQWHLSTLSSAATVSTGRPVAAAGRPAVRPQVLGRGGEAAARWLRGHSEPGDLVATNAHCLVPVRPGDQAVPCDSRHFWISAYAERRVLLEGWSYTESANLSARARRLPYSRAPFWDRGLLAANDAAFTAPSAGTVGDLRTRYGVRWLFADDRVPGLSSRLGDFATRRFRAAHFALYEIPAEPTHRYRSSDQTRNDDDTDEG